MKKNKGVRSVALGATMAVAVSALVAVAAPPATAAAPDAVLAPNPAYAGGAFKGWGTSLVWMANATGGYPASLRNELIDKVFGDQGLDLNIARYNIGGGNATDVPSYLRPGGAVPGWWNPDAPLTDAQGAITSTYADRDRYRAAWTGDNASDYDFSADQAQLAWVDAIKGKVDTWEAFSNSPPYFMTTSGFVSGGTDPNAEQIRSDSVGKFAKYLKTVVQNVEQQHGIHFSTIDPVNEPNTNYWGTTLGSNGWPTSASRQEGAHVGPAMQSAVVSALAAELAKPGTTTQAKISAPDETSPSQFVTDVNGWTDAAKAAVSQLNVHTYSTGSRQLVRDIAKSTGKPLWMSEVEGNWGGSGWNPNSIDNGLGIAGQINGDLRELESEAWVLWQPVEDLYNMQNTEKSNWGSIFVDFDCNAQGDSARRIADGAADPSCHVQVNSKYNTLRNFTHYIRPGDHLVRVDDNNTTAAIDGDGDGATLVYTNTGTASRTLSVDLSKFGVVGAGATVTPIVTTESPAGNPTANALVAGTPVNVDPATKTALVTVPAKSVTTLLVTHVSGVAASAPALKDGKSFTITGVQSGKNLTATSSSTQLGSASDPTLTSSQTWKATRVVDEPGTARDRFALRLPDGRALVSNGGSTAFKTLTDAQAAADPTAQWLMVSTDGKTFGLLNAARQQVLDVSGGSTSSGASVGLWQSNWGQNQLWSLTEVPGAASFPSTPLDTLVKNDFVLYFANSGAVTTDSVAPTDRMGLYQTRSDQSYGVDAKTGARWGYVADSTSNPKQGSTSTSVSRTQTLLYDAPPSGADRSARNVKYRFDIPNGTYDVTFGIQLPSSWPGRTLELNAEGNALASVSAGSTLVEKTFPVSVTDGSLDAAVIARNAPSSGSGDAAVSYLVVRSQVTWTTAVLSSLLAQTTGDAADYTPASAATWQSARAAAQALVDAGSTDTAAIAAAFHALTTAYDTLVAKLPPYTSFRPGQEWRDTNGAVIQAHGGQVVTSKDADGKTVYYLYGEDRTNGYHSSPGVHVYSSYDLYNWTDRGVPLRTPTSRSQLDTDPYFTALYGSYSQAQKDAVYRDLGTVPGPGETPPIIERPKVIHNAATGKWVMWAHMDGPTPQWPSTQYAKANAGVAVSDSPFGPFRYIDSYRLDHAAATDSTNQAPNNPGMARDMNLFVDDDGTGYIIYSSEENRTMFISKLNADYTDLATPADQAVEGVDYRRIFVNESREAPALFKSNGRYYILTSGTSGWSPNPTEYGTASSILGTWTEVGDPFPAAAQSNSFNSQPTSVIPVDAAHGKFIYMGDRWNGGDDLKNAQMVWLPLNMGEAGHSFSIVTPDEWTLGDLDQYASWDVTGVPATLKPGQGLNLSTVTVTQDGRTTSQRVTWTTASGSFDLPGPVTVTGTLPDFGGRTFTRTISVVPDGVRYVVNAGGQPTADWTAYANAARPTLNSGPDQAYGQDAATGANWGYISDGSLSSGSADGDMYSTLRYAVSGRDLTYRFDGLAAGSYSVYAGYYDPWAQWNNRGATVKINGASQGEYVFGGSYDEKAYRGVQVGADGRIDFTLSKSRTPDVQLSWLIVVLDQPAAPVLDVAVTAGARCVGGKNVVTVQLTNNSSAPVDAVLTSDFGAKTLSGIAAGKNGVHAFTTRQANLTAGSVAVHLTGTVGGNPVTKDVTAPYAANTCG